MIAFGDQVGHRQGRISIRLAADAPSEARVDEIKSQMHVRLPGGDILVDAAQKELSRQCKLWHSFGVEAGIGKVKIPEISASFNSILFMPQNVSLDRLLFIASKLFQVRGCRAGHAFDETFASLRSSRKRPYAVSVTSDPQMDEWLKWRTPFWVVRNEFIGITIEEYIALEIVHYADNQSNFGSDRHTICSGTFSNEGMVPMVSFDRGLSFSEVSWVESGENTIPKLVLT